MKRTTNCKPANGVLRKDNYVFGTSFDSEIGKDGLGCYIYEKMVQNADKICQINGITGESETYGETLTRSRRVALEMLHRGITDEDVVLLCSENTLDAFIPVCATQFLNMKIAAVDPSQSSREIAYLLELTKPKMGFIQKESIQLISEALLEAKLDTEIVCMGDDDHPNSFKNFLKARPEENDFKPKPVKDRKLPTFIMFSSGTTGMPKGLLCSGHAILNNAWAARNAGVTSKVGAHLATYYWLSAVIVTLLTLIDNGIKVAIPSRDIKVFMKAMSDHKVTFALNASMFGIGLTEEAVAGMDFTCLKNMVFGGCKFPEEHLRKCRKLLPNTIVVTGYGQTETPGYVSTFTEETYDLAIRKVDSVGLPIPGLIMKIVNPDTEELLEVNQQGEIRYKPKFSFGGYHNADSSNTFDEEGFIKTGDLGYFDEDNCLYIRDRLKDAFKYQSWHIIPAAIEDVLHKHPAVKQAVVVGVPHSEDGAHPLAAVVINDGFKNITETEISDFVNQRVSDRERLRAGVRFMEELPKTPTGKIMRRRIKEIALEKKDIVVFL